MSSPDVETFSTPPSSPMPAEHHDDGRRSSRPSNLRIQHSASSWTGEIQVDSEPSPNGNTHNPDKSPTDPVSHVNGPSTRHPNGAPVTSGSLSSSYLDNHPTPSPALKAHSTPITSPCFLHSQLQVQGASPLEWARSRSNNVFHNNNMGNVPGRSTIDMHPLSPSYPDGTISEPSSEVNTDREDYSVVGNEYDDEGYMGSLTQQLAETAVGVREMSKQLGRTRVRTHIQSVLIVTKARDNRLIKLTRDLALYLMLKQRHGKRGMIVYVDAQLRTSRRFDAARIEREHPQLFAPFPHRRTSSSSSSVASGYNAHDQKSPPAEGQLRYWTASMCSRDPDLFDFVVTLGGDGTVLFTSWLFQRIVPPVLPFALGSLGFLTNFDFADHQEVMDNVMENGLRVNLRMRFTCTVYRAVVPEKGKIHRAVKKGDTGEILMRNIEKDGWEALESGYPPYEGKESKSSKDKEIMCFSTRPVESFEVLNDLVVDRGPSPYVSLLELFGDEHHLTTVQADGLTIATPTGSTAYSLSAGGSLVHPEIPAILITPICPHTLSFRPMLLPDSMELRICVPFNSRSTAWASFDGRGRVELKQGDHIKVTASKYPFPTVCADTQSTDWFHSISRTLKWNERERQKSFVVVEEDPSRKRPKERKFSPADGESPVPGQPGHASHKPPREPPQPEAPLADNDEEDEVSDDGEEEPEEKYDIDDLSSNESPTGMNAAIEQNRVKPSEEKLGREKVLENIAQVPSQQTLAELAARSLYQGSPFQPSREQSGLHSGIETPDRFAGSHPHPPKVSPRHVAFAAPSSGSELSGSEMSISSMWTERESPRGEHGLRDEIYSPRMHVGTRSRIPRDRELELEMMKTPTAQSREGTWRRNLSRSRSRERREGSSRGGSRAFAVRGQDESDSATSDSDD